MPGDLSRRDFLGAAGSAAAASAFPHPAVFAGQDARVAANDTIGVALIGCGGMGGANLADFLRAPEVRILAVSDVDEAHAHAAAATVAKSGQDRPKIEADYRPILDRKAIDAVIIATPDHWHAIPFLHACGAGKDVYCEKPVAHNIVEGRAMVDAARKHKRVTQIGTQQRSGEHFQKAAKLIRGGKLGRVGLTRTWNFSNEAPDGLGKPADGPAPEGVDYDRWLGPAPARPFNPLRFHGCFRWFFDYASGMIGDWNVHLQDIVHMAMGVTAPRSVQAAGGKFAIEDPRDTPDTMVVTYEYESPGGPFVHIYEMRKGNGRGIGGDAGHGIQFHGSDATMLLDRGGFEIHPEGDRAAPLKNGGSDQHWPHVQDFMRCMKTRDRCVSDIETGHTSTTVCHLGNIALKVGRKIYWDAAEERITDKGGRPDEEACALLGREYRKGYELPRV